jgi:hypothetical protein
MNRAEQSKQEYLDTLTKEIGDLVASGQEGDYWDFKKEWYFLDRKADTDHAKRGMGDLLLDIICMANNTCFRDAYIIIGIDDGTYEILGVSDDDKNRRTTEKLSDFLRSQRFANGTIPKARVETIDLGRPVDVIAVESTCDGPYFLEEDKYSMRAGVIYSREIARNTPVNDGASGRQMEQLWQHHFLLDMSPLEHLLNGLRDKKLWEISPEKCTEKRYLTAAPEYTIEFADDYEPGKGRCTDFYCAGQENEQASFFSIVGRYHQTTLINRQGVQLDSGRYRTAVAEWGFIHREGMLGPDGTYRYKFYMRGTEPWILQSFLYNEESEEARIARDLYMDHILVFDSCQQRQELEQYVSTHWDELESLRSEDEPTGVEEFDGLERKVIVRDLKTVDALKRLYLDWLAKKECPEI